MLARNARAFFFALTRSRKQHILCTQWHKIAQVLPCVLTLAFALGGRKAVLPFYILIQKR